MSISLTSNQERFVQTKLEAGKYQSAEEVIELALKLLDEYEQSDAEWAKEVGRKIDEAIAASEHTPPVDGETFINDILQRFQQAEQA